MAYLLLRIDNLKDISSCKEVYYSPLGFGEITAEEEHLARHARPGGQFDVVNISRNVPSV